MEILGGTSFCEKTDVLLLFLIDYTLLMTYQPGAMTAPLGKILYLQNSKWPPTSIWKINY